MNERQKEGQGKLCGFFERNACQSHSMFHKQARSRTDPIFSKMCFEHVLTVSCVRNKRKLYFINVVYRVSSSLGGNDSCKYLERNMHKTCQLGLFLTLAKKGCNIILFKNLVGREREVQSACT